MTKVNEGDRIFVSYNELNRFVVDELFDCEAKPLSWTLAILHINKIPQHQGRCDLTEPMPIDFPKSAIGLPRALLVSAFEAISHIICEVSPGMAVVAPQAISKLVELTESRTTIIIRKTSDSKKPQKKKGARKDWQIANDLFKGPEDQFYDFSDGNKLVSEVKKKFKDLSDFCEWRVNKKRPALKLTMKEIEMEYERFKTPPVDLNTMKPAAKSETPAYRAVKLS